MPLFLFEWPDRISLLVEHEDEQLAGIVALKVAEVQPARVLRVPPGLFVAELYAEDAPKKGEPDVIVLDALDHVLNGLGHLLEDDQAAPPLRMVPSPLRPGEQQCASEADDAAGNPVRCLGRAGHTGVHYRGELVWGRA